MDNQKIASELVNLAKSIIVAKEDWEPSALEKIAKALVKVIRAGAEYRVWRDSIMITFEGESDYGEQHDIDWEPRDLELLFERGGSRIDWYYRAPDGKYTEHEDEVLSKGTIKGLNINDSETVIKKLTKIVKKALREES